MVLARLCVQEKQRKSEHQKHQGTERGHPARRTPIAGKNAEEEFVDPDFPTQPAPAETQQAEETDRKCAALRNAGTSIASCGFLAGAKAIGPQKQSRLPYRPSSCPVADESLSDPERRTPN